MEKKLEAAQEEEKRLSYEKRMQLKKLTEEDRAMKEHYKNSLKAP